MNKKHGS